MGQQKTGILIADDHLIVRYGAISLIKEVIPSAVFYEASTFSQAKSVLTENEIDLLILDINMPGADNFNMVETLKLRWAKLKILIFSAYSEDMYAMRYIQAGADGYVQKDISDEKEIIKSVKAVLAGRTYISDALKEATINNVIKRSDNSTGVDSLSNRELDVARLLIKGMGVFEISETLNLQMSTVSTYKKRLFEKLQVKNLIELIAQFEKNT